MDDPNLKITSTLFNGQNFMPWSQLGALYLRGQGKMGHLDGHITAPNLKDPTYDKWEIYNSIILAWLINSMVPKIGESYYEMKTGKDI